MRLIFGAALVAAIYVHSPYRPKDGLSDDVSRWASSAGPGLAEVVARAAPAQALADAALRHTLSEGAAMLVSRAAERSVPPSPGAPLPRNPSHGPL